MYTHSMSKSLLKPFFLLLMVSSMLFAGTIYEFGPNSGNYAIFIPSKPTNKLIVALHGSGERGRMYAEGWQKEAEARGYIVLAPNSLDPSGWSGNDIAKVMTVVDATQKKLSIKKTLLTGASAGGHFALYLGLTYYNYFDGIATFMGMVLNNIGEHIVWQTDPKKKRPILLVHGARDALIPIKDARMNYYFIDAKGYPVTFWEEPEMIHEFYTKDNGKILNWFEKIAR